MSDVMGPDDLLVLVGREFVLPGKDLYLVSYALMDYLTRQCRRWLIADGFAGPAANPGPGWSPGGPDLGGDILTTRVEVIAADPAPGVATAVAVLRGGFHAAGKTLPEQFSPAGIAALTAQITTGDELQVTWLTRTQAHRRAHQPQPHLNRTRND